MRSDMLTTSWTPPTQHTTNLNPEDTMTETINIAPNWAATAQMLILIINDSTNLGHKAWAESEVVRMGRIIDTLQAQQNELLESI